LQQTLPLLCTKHYKHQKTIKLNLNTTKEELSSPSSLEHHHRRKRRHIAIVFFFSNIKKTKHTRKQQKKKPREGREITFKLPMCPLTFAFLLLLSVSNAFPCIFFFSKRRKEKKHKEKKTIEKKKNAKKEGSSPSTSRSAFSFLALTSALLLLPFRFKRFFLASFSPQT